MNLAELKCEPCAAGGTPLREAEAKEQAREVPRWSLGENQIAREFRFKDFRQAMALVGKVADLAEAEGHHPDIYISYNRVRLVLSTHKIGGLSRNDFIMAAKIDLLPEARAGA